MFAELRKHALEFQQFIMEDGETTSRNGAATTEPALPQHSVEEGSSAGQDPLPAGSAAASVVSEPASDEGSVRVKKKVLKKVLKKVTKKKLKEPKDGAASAKGTLSKADEGNQHELPATVDQSARSSADGASRGQATDHAPTATGPLKKGSQAEDDQPQLALEASAQERSHHASLDQAPSNNGRATAEPASASLSKARDDDFADSIALSVHGPQREAPKTGAQPKTQHQDALIQETATACESHQGDLDGHAHVAADEGFWGEDLTVTHEEPGSSNKVLDHDHDAGQSSNTEVLSTSLHRENVTNAQTMLPPAQSEPAQAASTAPDDLALQESASDMLGGTSDHGLPDEVGQAGGAVQLPGAAQASEKAHELLETESTALIGVSQPGDSEARGPASSSSSGHGLASDAALVSSEAAPLRGQAAIDARHSSPATLNLAGSVSDATLTHGPQDHEPVDTGRTSPEDDKTVNVDLAHGTAEARSNALDPSESSDAVKGEDHGGQCGTSAADTEAELCSTSKVLDRVYERDDSASTRCSKDVGAEVPEAQELCHDDTGLAGDAEAAPRTAGARESIEPSADAADAATGATLQDRRTSDCAPLSHGEGELAELSEASVSGRHAAAATSSGEDAGAAVAASDRGIAESAETSAKSAAQVGATDGTGSHQHAANEAASGVVEGEGRLGGVDAASNDGGGNATTTSGSVNVAGYDDGGIVSREEYARLQEVVAARESQLAHQAQQLSMLQEATEKLQQRNEALILQAAKVSEQDLEEMRAEFEKRLGAAERKVYALTKERDSLKRAAAKAISPAMLQEKENIIQQVMSEGEKLSQTIMEHELTLKKLRATIKEKDAAAAKAAVALANEKQRADSLLSTKAHLEAALADAQAKAKADIEEQRASYERQLQALRASQSESRANAAASSQAQEALRAATAERDLLASSVHELQGALKAEAAAAAAAEERLRGEVEAATRRCRVTEERYAAAEAHLADTTRNLVRQVEAQQEAAQRQEAAWLAEEAALQERIRAAEDAISAEVDARHRAEQRVQSVQKLLEAAESRAEERGRALQELQQRFTQKEAALAAAQAARDELTQALQSVEAEAREYAETARELERRERELRQHSTPSEARANGFYHGPTSTGAASHPASRWGAPSMHNTPADTDLSAHPPAMAGPNMKWILVRDDDEDVVQHASRKGEESSSSLAPATQSQTGEESQDVNVRAMEGELKTAVTGSRDELDEVTSPMRGVGRHGSGTFTEDTLMRDALRARTREIKALQRQLRHAEELRGRMNEELYRVADEAEAGRRAVEREQQALQELAALQARYDSAVELLGEKDEQLSELRADLEDVKALYREQIEFMVEKLAVLNSDGPEPSRPGAALAQNTEAVAGDGNRQ